MPEISQQFMENVITPMILEILHSRGIPAEVITTTAIQIDENLLPIVDSWGVVLALMYEAICTGYLLGVDNATEDGEESTPKSPSNGGTVS